MVDGYARKTSDATLGYVSTTPGPGLVPVYALGDSARDSDNVDCYFMRWPESRVKKYTTDDSERAQMLAAHFRDDGIAFYAPKPGTAGTANVYLGTDSNKGPLYVTPGPEYDKRKGDGGTFTPAFSVFTAAAPDLEPLMRVHYENECGRAHDELAAGQAKFNKAYKQGFQPINELHWSGLTKETVLVVEAVDKLCPFQGVLSPRSRPARVDPFMAPATDIHYPAFLTLDEMRAASPTGEVYVSGEGDAGVVPHAIARACVKVSPSELPAMDFRYEGDPEQYAAEKMADFQTWQTESPTFNAELYATATDEWAIGGMLGELWTVHADWAADTGGKLRMTAKQMATLAADSFIHATMEVDTVSTDRRYPQLIISDQPWPVQDNLPNGNTLVVQTRSGNSGPTEAQIQFCDHRTWDVNNQCPQWDLFVLGGGDGFLSPRPEMNGMGGVDRTVRFDVYASTSRVYLFTNGIPYGCADLPPGKIAAGPATVTFGDVLYHSAVDFSPGVSIPTWYPFHEKHMHMLTTRHFSNLGFSSHVPAPGWDENRIPCSSPSTLMQH
jgi:hypothetical protein